MDKVTAGDRLGRLDHTLQRTQTEPNQPQPDENGDGECTAGDRELEEQQAIERAGDP